MHFVKNIIDVKPYMLKLEFEDQSVRKIDLSEKLQQWSASSDSIFKRLLDETYFKQVRLNTDLETIYWDNGVDFCPDMLYQWSVQA
jgi:hypothetical protein